MKQYKDIAIKYFQQYKQMEVKGDATALLAPYYLMDIAYQIYCKEIKNREFKHEARKYLTDFAKEYKAFNSDLFRTLTMDEADFMMDEMDNLGTELHNYIEMCKMELYTALDAYGESARDVLASILLCDLLCQIAGLLWTNLYVYLPNRKGETNMHLKYMRKCLIKMANSYERDLNVDFVCNLNNAEKLKNTCFALANKVVTYLNREDDE